ncbi:MAG: hypothetical protein Q8R13_02755 [bacterium]|nr:hypothetical protein [bacterium]
MVLESWVRTIAESLQTLWFSFVAFLPSLVGAAIVFIVGWLVATGLGKIVSEVVRATRIDMLLERLGVGETLERAKIKLDAGLFIGWLVKWFFVIVFLLAAADILRLEQFTQFLTDVLLYIPSIVIAVLVLLAAVVVGNVLERIVEASVAVAGGPSAHFLGAMTRWAVLIFGLLAALVQLGIAPSLINTLFTGLVALLAIAGGLAFGLGGRGAAEDFLAKIRKDISR